MLGVFFLDHKVSVIIKQCHKVSVKVSAPVITKDSLNTSLKVWGLVRIEKNRETSLLKNGGTLTPPFSKVNSEFPPSWQALLNIKFSWLASKWIKWELHNQSFTLCAVSIFYTAYIGLWSKEARSNPCGLLALVGELKPEISGDHSFLIIDSS